MSDRERHPNPGLDTLLDLDGQVFVVDPNGGYWVKFMACRVPASTEKPAGVSYSLTLHDAAGRRLVGFDNTHAVRKSARPGGKGRGSPDHKHRLGTVRPYTFRNAATLLQDFWKEVDSVLKEKGVL
jgi:hypothetical protein